MTFSSTAFSNEKFETKRCKISVNSKIETLVVLIEFADRSAYFTRNEVDSFFNQVGYKKYNDNGSVHDYWAAVSQNRIDLHANVTAYYKAPKNFSYYDTDGGTGHTHELLDSALNWLDKTGFDFSKLSVDANKNIKGLSFQFVGNSGAKGLWGHSSSHSRTFDGVNTSRYQISELGTSQMRLGGICHEQGHMLFGWPDSYDIDANNGGSSGCGKFDLMAGGNSDNTGAPSANPMPPNPYFRYLAGWNDMIPLNTMPNNATFKIIANDWNTYVYRNPDKSGEMYIVEARRKPYRNVDMPGEGVLVWHIDSVIPNNANQQHTDLQHYKISVVQADSKYDLENGSNVGDVNDYFRSGSTLSTNRTTWWNGALSGLVIRSIGAVSDTMPVIFGTASATDVAVKSTKTLGGIISPFGLKYYSLNSVPTYTATASTGFEVDYCMVDGASEGSIGKYVFGPLTDSHTIDFSFIHKATPLKAITNGVNYQYFEGAWSSLPDFSTLTPLSTGRLSSFTLSIAGRASDNFGVRYTGFIKAFYDGEYTFYLTADDGAKFSIDGNFIVTNNCQSEQIGKIRLRAGYHPFVLDFFEAQITETLGFAWSGPNMTKRQLSGSMLATGTVDLTPVESVLDQKNSIWTVNGCINIGTPEYSGVIHLELYNVAGTLVLYRDIQVEAGIAKLSTQGIRKGFYVARIKRDGSVFVTEKIIVK